MTELSPEAICTRCGQASARPYERYHFSEVGEVAAIEQRLLCVKCARQERKAVGAAPLPLLPQLSRAELILELDRFWRASGAGEICRRCHEQGTGCCPPTCRYLGAEGCERKNVFCTGFVCSALLSALRECDPTLARTLKWIKNNAGAAEFRVYEMVTRVAAVDRESARPMALPTHYPGRLNLAGEQLKAKLLGLTEEVLEIRRHWHQQELAQVQDRKLSQNQAAN